MIEYLEPFTIRMPKGEAWMALQVFEENDRICCGIYHLEGGLDQPPKQWVRIVRDEMKKIETLAIEAGCAELRLGGRDWSRIFPEFEPLPGIANGLRKVLLNGR